MQMRASALALTATLVQELAGIDAPRVEEAADLRGRDAARQNDVQTVAGEVLRITGLGGTACDKRILFGTRADGRSHPGARELLNKQRADVVRAGHYRPYFW
jgi:hypothetical protein